MERKAMLGHKVRRLRRENRLTQAQMAETLAISPSYLNLIESNQRPLTVPLLLRLGQAFDVDLTSFAEDEDSRLVASLREVFADPLFEGGDIKGQDFRELATGAPTLGHAILTLYRAYREAREDIQALAEKMADGDRLQVAAAGAFPQEEVGEFFQNAGNHFPDLEIAAETLWIEGDLSASDLFSSLTQHLEKAHKVKVKLMPGDVMGNSVRRYDRHAKRVLISEMLAPSGRTFQVATQIALLTHRALMEGIVERAGLTTEPAKSLALVGLANYFAGAVLMPYGRILEAARTVRYDLEILMRRFVASYEQVCHRLTTLQRPGAKGVPFFLIRADSAGNVSKRFSAATGFHFARFGGACPRWNLHDAFRMPGQIHTQLAQMPDGAVYFSIARTVDKPGGGWKSPARQFALALGCEVAQARQLVYADGVALDKAEAATPVGVNCRICPRTDCAQRAFPALNHRLEVDVNVRGLSSFVGPG